MGWGWGGRQGRDAGGPHNSWGSKESLSNLAMNNHQSMVCTVCFPWVYQKERDLKENGFSSSSTSAMPSHMLDSLFLDRVLAALLETTFSFTGVCPGT